MGKFLGIWGNFPVEMGKYLLRTPDMHGSSWGKFPVYMRKFSCVNRHFSLSIQRYFPNTNNFLAAFGTVQYYKILNAVNFFFYTLLLQEIPQHTLRSSKISVPIFLIWSRSGKTGQRNFDGRLERRVLRGARSGGSGGQHRATPRLSYSTLLYI